ncbi:glycoside hydrolase family 32 protein [Cetobacterium somerae]|uniref:glycoside hydrolase family 32 protein n=1 Tax=unclassified Cetobacterium TaxID=2630983 RepID=UPI0021172812|nr:glycoside hydrolase family 32 protein [Cetobacterium sp. NK01]MCQ8213699.1 glycoside hydrolase family 32 protein [Cetobacterium sp. NK01]
MSKRPLFHFTPEKNWMNDPNGLSHFNGEYHIFYQHNPENCYWGNMTWGHAKSKDLFAWEHLEHALYPDSKELGDIDGCFSGSAFVKDNELHLFYTGVEMTTKRLNEFGNTITVGDDDLISTQILAKSKDGINFEKVAKLEVPIPEKTCTAHIRDPKVWETDGKYYMVLGAKDQAGGKILMYESDDLKNWNIFTELKEANMGFMWECPDLFEIGGKEVLVFSPQGIGTDGQVHIAGYYLGDFDYEKKEFLHSDLKRLDNGFEFYAPQSFLDEKGRRVLIGWLVNHAPLPGENFTGIMTIPRELNYKDGKLYQMPVKEIEKYRNKELGEFSELDNKNQYDLNLKIGTDKDFTLILFENNGVGLKLHFDFKENKIILDRSDIINDFKVLETFGLKRELNLEIKEPSIELRVIVDKCVAEIYINNGEYVMSAVVNPKLNQNKVILIGEILEKKIYELKR